MPCFNYLMTSCTMKNTYIFLLGNRNLMNLINAEVYFESQKEGNPDDQ